MTCPTCARNLAHQLDQLVHAGRITPQLRDHTLNNLDTTKDHDMHIIHARYATPTAGDIGEEQEETEVIPTPIHVPQPAPDPVPAA